MRTMTVRIAQADVPNLNGRVYPRSTLENMIAEFEAKMNPARVFGTIGMPEGTTVDVSKISHSVSNLRIDSEGYLIGDVAVLETPQGEIMEKILDVEKDRSFRLAGIGKLQDNPDGTTTVVDYRMISVNYVRDGA